MWESLIDGAFLLLRWDTFGIMAVGLFLGMFVGALPGFTTVMAMALVLPISFFMHPLVGIPFLIGVYKGGIYGGSIPAILIGVPGTGASIATTIDGPALARKGKGKKALEMALFASVFGDLSSDVITLFLIVPIAMIALLIGPPELSAIIVLALIVVAASSVGNLMKGLVMACLGVMLAMIGQDPVDYIPRFTFGSSQLVSGLPLLPMMIGLFAIPEILGAIERAAVSGEVSGAAARMVATTGERLRFSEFRACFKSIVRSTGIGTVLGILPGVGQSVAAFAGYAAAKKNSKHPETFGKGDLEGVAAPEAANNAVNGPTLVPLLTLGIPGDKVTAILLGAFMAHGLRPGPSLMTDHGAEVFALLLAMILANVLFLGLAYFCIPLFARIVTLKRFYLVPIIVLVAFAGSYVYRSDSFDLQILVLFGIIGYCARKLEFDVVPLVMGFILGPELEYSIAQTTIMARGEFLTFLFTERYIAAGLYTTIVVALAYFGYRAFTRKPKKSEGWMPVGDDLG
jgi:putative tricarboxylic transport membrane protein